LILSGITSNDICCPSQILADKLDNMKNDPKFASKSHLPIFLIGPPGLENFLKKRGIEVIGTGPDPMPNDKVRNNLSAKIKFKLYFL
jgi:hypothetical protein